MIKRVREILAGLAFTGAAVLGAHDGIQERGQNKPAVESKDSVPKDVNSQIRDAVRGTFCVGKDFENALDEVRGDRRAGGDGSNTLSMNTDPRMENVIQQNRGRQAEFDEVVDKSLLQMEKEGRLIEVTKGSLNSIIGEVEGNLIEAGFMPNDV